MKKATRKKAKRAKAAGKQAIRKRPARKKAAATKAARKRTAPKRAAAKKAARKRTAATKAAAKKAARKRPARKTAAAKKAPAKKPARKVPAPPKAAAPQAAPPKRTPVEKVLIQWQAHRGGGGFERPDNTMVSFLYGWDLGGIPEADVRQTLDGRIICLHDPTLTRTTNAPAEIADIPVAELRYEQFAGVDAGAKFSPEYVGQRVPLLEDVLARMAERPQRRMYLDLKGIDLRALADMIRRFALQGRIYVASPKLEECEGIKQQLPGVRTIQWCGGTEAEIQAKFRSAAAGGFYHLDQIQLHLNDEPLAAGWRYQIKPAFVTEALQACAARGVDLEVLPWKFERKDIEALLDLGVRWFATDEPKRFLEAVEGWQAARAGGGRG